MASSAISPLIFLSLLPFLPLFAASNVPLGSSPSATGDNSSLVLKGASNPAEVMYDLIEVPSINFPFGDNEKLQKATKGFKEELGRDSFSIVYKGVVKYGSKTQVAVKKLDKLSHGRDREFKAEVNAIGRTHHKNLVQLLGCCYEGTHRLLVIKPSLKLRVTSSMASSALPPLIFLSLLPLFAASNVPLGSSLSATGDNSSLVDNGASNPEDLYNLIEVPNINFPFGDYESLGPYNLTECTQACSQDCDCVVAIFNGISCWKKILMPILEEDDDFEEDDNFEEGDYFEKVLLLPIDSSFECGCRKSVAQEFEDEERAILTDRQTGPIIVSEKGISWML
ncbi:hypothetical protein RHGRI_020255 [Rhododendron griersonianum]|uniref:Tyrosine-protein kinase catalytic domain-containing protein n=1 Tax=Rhododendron griersonianum TaxID=479676 RepID=A0AAV6JIH0_9ERIC|nr:hypothetical protein RHGRI_020255 [Rhododendron griersonianum]